MMLGLQYGTVNLAASDPTWAQLFRDEEARLCAAGLPPECLVEHVGSTAVPGLAAKPILDIAIGVPVDVAVSDVIAAIERAGYLYRGDAGSEGGHVLVREAAPQLRTHHVHVVGVTDQQWSSYLVLRDWLRSHPQARVAYERAKYQFAASYSNDRRAYTAAKARLIAELLSVAKSE